MCILVALTTHVRMYLLVMDGLGSDLLAQTHDFEFFRAIILLLRRAHKNTEIPE